MASNTCTLSRSYDGTNWTVLKTVNTTTGGVTSDFFFDFPASNSVAYYRIFVQDFNGNSVGSTNLIGVNLSR